MEQINMPAGAYYVGDPCLIIKGTPGYHWIEKLWSLFYKLDQRAALLEVDGVKIFIGQTYGGDRIYDGITVDTGTIAVIPVGNLSGDSALTSIISRSGERNSLPPRSRSSSPTIKATFKSAVT